MLPSELVDHILSLRCNMLLTDALIVWKEKHVKRWMVILQEYGTGMNFKPAECYTPFLRTVGTGINTTQRYYQMYNRRMLSSFTNYFERDTRLFISVHFPPLFPQHSPYSSIARANYSEIEYKFSRRF